MSWQSYVDNLQQYPGVTAAVLCGKDGSQVYAQGGVNATPAELKQLAACLTAPQSSVTIGGQKYLVIRCDDEGLEGKNQAHGISVRKTNTLMVCAMHHAKADEASEQSMGAKLACATTTVAGHLHKSGY